MATETGFRPAQYFNFVCINLSLHYYTMCMVYNEWDDKFCFITMKKYFYRPQRSCGQGNIFTPVCHSVHRGGVCLSACWDTPPPDQTPPPGPGRHPRDQTPRDQAEPPRTRHHHPPTRQTAAPEADSSIRSMSGRYASYWNAFLFYKC